MKSIKPGRGPSLLRAVIGLFMIGFGLVWVKITSDVSPIFSLFGIFWTCIVAVITIFNLFNAFKRKRNSIYDITENNEENDPLNERFGGSRHNAEDYLNRNSAPFHGSAYAGTERRKFCPYCGTELEQEFRFCSNCGKKLP